MSLGNDVKAPTMKLSDIVVFTDHNATEIVHNCSSSSTLSEPSVILDDWLYLGNRYHARSRELLEHLNITHVLNITATIPCSFPDIIQYARIQVFDESTVKLYEYFEAAVSYIDLCNPLNYDINKEPNKRKRRILVHCAMGISRSATVTIAYLMSRTNALNKTEQKIIDHIQEQLEEFDQEIETKINENCFDGSGWTQNVFENHRKNKDLTKRIRNKYGKHDTVSNVSNDNNGLCSTLRMPLSTHEEKGSENDTDVTCIGLTLGESYLFVLERRSIICPNIGFCRQLDVWEKLVWNTNDSTLYQVPFFRPDLNNYKNKSVVPKRRNSDKNYHRCSEQCCTIL